MQDSSRIQESYRRATDILETCSSSFEKKTALRALHEPLGGRRTLTLWHPILEKIINLHLSLCIELNQLDLARKALERYKLITQHSNINSLCDVFAKFLKQLEQRIHCEDVTTEISNENTLSQSEESLHPLVFTSDEPHDEMKKYTRQLRIVTVWETYQFAFKLLKSNPKLTIVFLQIIQRATKFCEEHILIAELREILRTARKHIDRAQKLIVEGSSDAKKVLLGTPDVLYAYMETWTQLFHTLSSSKMEMWQEAYRLADTMNFTLNEAFPGLNAQPNHFIFYFDSLAKIFWVATLGSHQYLYHAYALLQLWKQKKKHGFTDVELAGIVFIASLCVPFLELSESNETGTYRNVQFTAGFLTQWKRLVGLRYNLSRSTLFQEIEKNILPHCHEFLKGVQKKIEENMVNQKLYLTLEKDLYTLEKKSAYVQYIPPLRSNIVVKVISIVLETQSTMKITQLSELCGRDDFSDLEPTLLKVASACKSVPQIDVENDIIAFTSIDNDLFSSAIVDLRQDIENALYKSIPIHEPFHQKRLVKHVLASLNNERQKLFSRLELIEKRRNAHDIEQDESRKKKILEKQQQNAQQRREAAQQLERERKNREEKSKLEEERQKTISNIMNLIERLENVTHKKLPELHKNIDKETLIRIAQKHLAIERQKAEDHAIADVKRMDFFFRALREREWPALKKLCLSCIEEARANVKIRIANQAELLRIHDERVQIDKDRLMRMNNSRLRWGTERIRDRQRIQGAAMKKRTQEQEVMDELARGAAASHAPMETKADATGSDYAFDEEWET